MSRDRLVYYGAVRPKRREITDALVRYVGDVQCVRRKEGKAWVVEVRGDAGNAWLTPPAYPDAVVCPVPERRWFEVFDLSDCLSVVTRPFADDLTNAVADGFAQASAYAFGTAERAQREEWWAGHPMQRERIARFRDLVTGILAAPEMYAESPAHGVSLLSGAMLAAGGNGRTWYDACLAVGLARGNVAVAAETWDDVRRLATHLHETAETWAVRL